MTRMLPQATRRSPSTGPAANPIKYPAPNAVAAMVQVIIHQAGGLLQHEHFDAQIYKQLTSMPEEYAMRALETLAVTRWETVKRPTPFIMRRINHYWNLFHDGRTLPDESMFLDRSAQGMYMDAASAMPARRSSVGLGQFGGIPGVANLMGSQGALGLGHPVMPGPAGVPGATYGQMPMGGHATQRTLPAPWPFPVVPGLHSTAPAPYVAHPADSASAQGDVLQGMHTRRSASSSFDPGLFSRASFKHRDTSSDLTDMNESVFSETDVLTPTVSHAHMFGMRGPSPSVMPGAHLGPAGQAMHSGGLRAVPSPGGNRVGSSLEGLRRPAPSALQPCSRCAPIVSQLWTQALQGLVSPMALASMGLMSPSAHESHISARMRGASIDIPSRYPDVQGRQLPRGCICPVLQERGPEVERSLAALTALGQGRMPTSAGTWEVPSRDARGAPRPPGLDGSAAASTSASLELGAGSGQWIQPHYFGGQPFEAPVAAHSGPLVNRGQSSQASGPPSLWQDGAEGSASPSKHPKFDSEYSTTEFGKSWQSWQSWHENATGAVDASRPQPPILSTSSAVTAETIGNDGQRMRQDGPAPQDQTAPQSAHEGDAGSALGDGGTVVAENVSSFKQFLATSPTKSVDLTALGPSLADLAKLSLTDSEPRERPW